MRHAKLAIAAVSIAIVGAVAWWEFGRLTSPGALHASHANLPELRGSTGCIVCHGDQQKTMAEACIACHGLIGQHMASQTGLHGNLTSISPDQCQLCHIEHSDSAVALVSLTSFRSAGVPKPERYMHEHIAGFTLSGRHTEVACTGCHQHASAASLAPGERRYTGLIQTCTTCHEDTHQGAYGNDCASCHGQQVAFELVAAFEHTSAFPLVDSHARVSCKSCHADNTPYAIANIHTRSHETVRVCIDCHASSHSSAFLSAIAAQSAIPSRETCTQCHAVSHDSFLYPHAIMTPQAHAATGFKLDPPHDKQECRECHTSMGTRQAIADTPGPAAALAWFVPGRTNAECRACHGDPHQGQFDAPSAAAQCLSCHDATHFVPSTFDAHRHNQTRFTLAGAHAGAACAECHVKVKGVSRFADTPMSCASCHKDPHQGQFASSQGDTDCAACHDVNAFKPALFDLQLHEQTAFPLTGAHRITECTACHATLDGVQRFIGTPVACIGCHNDPHGGQFLGRDATSDCAACHYTVRFQPTQFDIGRHGATRFPLRGAHTAVGCRECHKEQNEVRQFVAIPGDCASCHVDVHNGAFEGPNHPAIVDNNRGCARCHNETTFSDVHWTGDTHAQWTGYRLVGAHASITCAACHRDKRSVTPGRAVFRSVSSDCASCHTDPHVGQFAVNGSTNCARCHTEQTTFAQTTFDHQRDSAFVLDETHRKLSCNQCHKPVDVGGGLFVNRYRPLGRECQDCHGFRFRER